MNVKQNQLEWRRRMVFEMSAKGMSGNDIASELKISEPTISRDIQYIRQKCKTNLQNYIQEELPEQYEHTLYAMNLLIKEIWQIYNEPENDNRSRLQAISLLRDCYTSRLELLTNASVINDSLKAVNIRFKKKQEQLLKQKEQLLRNNNNNKEENKDDNEVISTTTPSIITTTSELEPESNNDDNANNNKEEKEPEEEDEEAIF
jgi:hypothetical protein